MTSADSHKLLAVIPARGGSKGLPGKNIKPFCGVPLIAHSILLARSCPEISRTVISTDSPQIAEVAREYGGEVPFIRPSNLAQDGAPLFPVLQHALAFVESDKKQSYAYVALFDPTTPCRQPSYLSEALSTLEAQPQADGIVAVSEPDFNPLWNCVVEKGGWMTQLIPEGATYHRRQDAPVVYRMNGALYIWRAEFMRKTIQNWRTEGKYLMYKIPDVAAISIDTEEEFRKAELLVKSGFIHLPWLKPS